MYAPALQIAALIMALVSSSVHAADARTVISLDGTWQISEGSLSQPPAEYDHTVPVPGLADLASPPFESPGATVSLEDRGKPWLRPADPRREAFWYRRTFRLDQPLPAVALLKVHKARYGTQVFLNGQAVGEHGPCFTPGWFDVRHSSKRRRGRKRTADSRRRVDGPDAAAPATAGTTKRAATSRASTIRWS